MTSSPKHKHVGLNPYAPVFIPSPYPYYIFFYPLTLYNINNYQQQTHLYHAHPTPPTPAPSPAAAPPQVSAHNQLKNQEIVQSHPRRRFGGACNKNRFFNKRVEEKKGGYFNFDREKIGNQNYGESGAAACRVVQTCVMLNRRPKPVMPLTYGEENVDVDANITTVMIRNIPNKLTRNELFELLDKHCMSMNEARKDCEDQNYSAYDFVYLPIDFKTVVNKGYAFVNFTNAKAVKKFHNVYHDKEWDGFKTPKICEIVCAKIQGKDELVKHFGGTIFVCRCDEYLPVCFRPPRDGSGKEVEELIVGQRSSQNLTPETKKKVRKACSGRVTVTVGEHSSENLCEIGIRKKGDKKNQFVDYL